MDPKRLVRDAARVKAALAELPDGRLVAKKPVKIYVPARFAERGLASIGSETYIAGIYAIVLDDTYYGVSLINAMHRIEPTSTLKIVVGDDEYYEFFFEAGATVISSLDLVRTDTLVYRIYDEILSKGRVPWYLSYAELGKIFDSARAHAGANIGSNNEVTELIVSVIARNPERRSEYYRQSVKSLEDLKKNPPVFVPLRSVSSVSGTVNKLAGSYFSEGLNSALVEPSDRVERLDALLRS